MPGRPVGGPGDVRGRLLDAAVCRFAHQGIAATSLRDIASEAGGTPALIHYYFGGKDALQAAVIEEKVMPLIQSLREPLLQSGGDLRALVSAFVRTTIGIATANPWLPQLWVREVLQDGGQLRSLMLERIGPLVPRMMAMFFAQAQSTGGLNPRIDPRLLVASIMGQTMFLVAAAPIWRRLFDADDVDADALSRHVLALLESGLELGDG
jgi:TetR/AcrR family transcriptional regulator